MCSSDPYVTFELFEYLWPLYIKPAKGYTPEGSKSSEEQNDLSHSNKTTS